jgi:hypothetical protein
VWTQTVKSHINAVDIKPVTVNAIVKFRRRRWRIQGLNPQEVQDSNFMRVPQTDAHSLTGVSLTNNCHHENICEHWIVFFQGPSSVPRSSTNLSSIPFHCEWPFANWAWIFCFSTVFSCSDIRFGVQLSTLVQLRVYLLSNVHHNAISMNTPGMFNIQHRASSLCKVMLCKWQSALNFKMITGIWIQKAILHFTLTVFTDLLLVTSQLSQLYFT